MAGEQILFNKYLLLNRFNEIIVYGWMTLTFRMGFSSCSVLPEILYYIDDQPQALCLLHPIVKVLQNDTKKENNKFW